jgi:hypothetical protein
MVFASVGWISPAIGALLQEATDVFDKLKQGRLPQI